MKILMTADTVGGVWTYALELIRALEPHDVQVHLATMGAPLSDDQWREALGHSNLQLHESSYKLEWMDEPWHDVQAAGEWLLELAGWVQPDVVHLNGFAHGNLAWDAPVLVVGHSCVLSWWLAVKHEDAPPSWARYRDVVTRGLQAVDAVVTPTRAMLDTLDDHYGPLPQPQVIFNAREQSTFVPARKEPYIFTAGRLWDEAKNIAALEVVAPHLTWPVRVAGDNCIDDQTVRTVQGSVQFMGRLSATEIVRQMSRAAIYALPARYEPFGLSALEAGLCGCALVLGDIPSLREVWGEDALFVSPDDHEQLAATLQRLIDNEAERLACGERARRRALQYAPEKMAREYLSLYMAMLPDAACHSILLVTH